jgi:nucleotide-binding universal stress UspA family protein
MIYGVVTISAHHCAAQVDIIAAGAYGHSRAQVFGGVTDYPPFSLR